MSIYKNKWVQNQSISLNELHQTMNLDQCQSLRFYMNYSESINKLTNYRFQTNCSNARKNMYIQSRHPLSKMDDHVVSSLDLVIYLMFISLSMFLMPHSKEIWKYIFDLVSLLQKSVNWKLPNFCFFTWTVTSCERPFSDLISLFLNNSTYTLEKATTYFVIKNDSFFCFYALFFLNGTLIKKAVLKELFYNTFNGSLQKQSICQIWRTRYG